MGGTGARLLAPDRQPDAQRVRPHRGRLHWLTCHAALVPVAGMPLLAACLMCWLHATPIFCKKCSFAVFPSTGALATFAKWPEGLPWVSKEMDTRYRNKLKTHAEYLAAEAGNVKMLPAGLPVLLCGVAGGECKLWLLTQHPAVYAASPRAGERAPCGPLHTRRNKSAPPPTPFPRCACAVAGHPPPADARESPSTFFAAGALVDAVDLQVSACGLPEYRD